MSDKNFNTENSNLNLMNASPFQTGESFLGNYTEQHFVKAIQDTQSQIGNSFVINFTTEVSQKELLAFLYEKIKQSTFALKILFSTDEFLDLFSKSFFNTKMSFCAWILPNNSTYAIHSCPKMLALTIANNFYQKKYSQIKTIIQSKDLSFLENDLKNVFFKSLSSIDYMIFTNQSAHNEQQIISAINLENPINYKNWCSNILETHSTNNHWNGASSLSIEDFKTSLNKFDLHSDFSIQAIEKRFYALLKINARISTSTNQDTENNNILEENPKHQIEKIDVQPNENFVNEIFDSNLFSENQLQEPCLIDFYAFDTFSTTLFSERVFIKSEIKSNSQHDNEPLATNVENQFSLTPKISKSAAKTEKNLEQKSTILPINESVEEIQHTTIIEAYNEKIKSLNNKGLKHKTCSTSNAKKNVKNIKSSELEEQSIIIEALDNIQTTTDNKRQNELQKENDVQNSLTSTPDHVYEPNLSSNKQQIIGVMPIVHRNRAARIIVPKIEPSDFLPSTRAALEERTKQRTLGKVGKFAKETFSKKNKID